MEGWQTRIIAGTKFATRAVGRQDENNRSKEIVKKVTKCSRQISSVFIYTNWPSASVHELFFPCFQYDGKIFKVCDIKFN